MPSDPPLLAWLLAHGTEFAVSLALVGSRVAVHLGDGPVLVSPAMYDLIRHSDGAELRRLLAAIPVRRLAGCRPGRAAAVPADALAPTPQPA